MKKPPIKAIPDRIEKVKKMFDHPNQKDNSPSIKEREKIDKMND